MPSLPLFAAYGVELEYMIVDAKSLNVRPIADELLKAVSGDYSGDYEAGPIAWSNELALHVIELKTNGPAASLEPLPQLFRENLQRINEVLAGMNARLLPTAMHPWMDPDRELKLWPHENSPIYNAFNRIFDCRGHGWANLQSLHLNLPFSTDEEFSRLHAAVRLLLPLLPGLAASSPVMDARATGVLDNRLEVYRTNCQTIPSVAGHVIPEQAFTRVDYDTTILQPMFAEIAPHDPEGVLQDEFLNARGAIARFNRGTIEIRVLDVQEHPAADLAICALIVEVLKSMAAETWSPVFDQQAVEIAPLERIFVQAVRDAEETTVNDVEYLRHFGLADLRGANLKLVWSRLIQHFTETNATFAAHWRPLLETYLQHGTLARRILRRVGERPSRAVLKRAYSRLADALVSTEYPHHPSPLKLLRKHKKAGAKPDSNRNGGKDSEEE